MGHVANILLGTTSGPSGWGPQGAEGACSDERDSEGNACVGPDRLCIAGHRTALMRDGGSSEVWGWSCALKNHER